MIDFSILAKTSPRFERVVKEYLKKGGHLTIDAYSMSYYPLETNWDFYLKFNEASSITLRGIAETAVPDLMDIFPNIRRLTLTDMLILNDVSGFGRSLSDLKLIRVEIEPKLFKEMLFKTKDTLKSLHINGLETGRSNNFYSLYSFNLNEMCPNLRSLVIKGQSTEMLLEENLKIKTSSSPGRGTSNPLLFPLSLESLKYDGCSPSLPYTVITGIPIKSLTMKRCPIHFLPATLEYLKLLDAVDYKYKADIARLQIKSVDVVFFNEPVTAQPKPNLIFTLNEDCLLEVLKHLTLDDHYAISKAHLIFHRLVTTHMITDLNMHLFSSSDALNDKEFWQQVAPWLRKISVQNSATNYELLWILPLCTGLRAITFDWVKLAKHHKTELSTQLKRNQSQMDVLVELSVDSMMDLELLLDILYRNKETLEIFRFKYRKEADWLRYESIWEVIGGMNISHIEISEGMVKHTGFDPYLERLLSFVGNKVKKFKLHTLSDESFHLLNEINLPQLENLELHFNRGVTNAHMKVLSALKKLTKLSLNFYGARNSTPINASELVHLVKSLPNLTELRSEIPVVIPLGISHALKDDLKQDGRFLSIHLVGGE